MSNIRTLINQKTALARSIRAIQEDYSGVAPEDMPEEVLAELREMRKEMQALREQVQVKQKDKQGFEYKDPNDSVATVVEELDSELEGKY